MKIKFAALFAVVIIAACGIKSLSYSYSAKSICLYDPVSGRSVYSHNENEKMLPASITKIVTAITALELGNPGETVTVSKNASLVEGSKVHLKENQRVQLLDLLYGMMLHSGNDAATAVAEHFGYDFFINAMNETALKSGALNSRFENPSGLDGNNHLVTAADMAKITAYSLKNPIFREIVSTKNKNITLNDEEKRYLKNHNKLLWMYDNALGVKTGFTKKAGRTLVSYAKDGEKELICVTLNDPDDWNDHLKLYKEYLK